jgi:hypothetical protein
MLHIHMPVYRRIRFTTRPGRLSRRYTEKDGRIPSNNVSVVGSGTSRRMHCSIDKCGFTVDPEYLQQLYPDSSEFCNLVLVGLRC